TQTGHCPAAGTARRDESAQFRTRLHQRNEDDARKVCGVPARRSSSPAVGRKSEQHGNDRSRMRFRERQFNAQRFSADPENRAWPISSPLSPRETSASKIQKQPNTLSCYLLGGFNQAATDAKQRPGFQSRN